MKIYLVDDDKDIIESISMLLESEGHQVGHQTDEVDAPKNIEAFGADMVILDVMFPENDSAGFEIARAIRAHEPIKDIPVLMLSAVNNEGQSPVTFSNKDTDDTFMPVNQFIEKPIKPEVLIAKIKELTSA
ncbi:response regulator transcription factor [Verrucomicrobiota bacterium]